MFFVFKKIFILVSFTLLIVFKMVMFIMGIMFCNKKENAPARTLHTIKPCALCNSDCVVSFSSRNQSIRETGEEPKIVCFDCAFWSPYASAVHAIISSGTSMCASLVSSI